MIILYLLYAIGGFLAVFYLRIRRHDFYNLAERSVSLLNDLLTAEDDDKKLEMLTSSTNKLVASLGKIVLILIASVTIFGAPSSVYNVVTSGLFFSPALGTGYGILALSIGASIPFFLPNKQSGNSYSELAMLLHRLMLNNYTIGLRLFKREKRQVAKRGVATSSKFVVVSGLARSGTTSLLNNLMETNQFVSLNYANMPFLLSPNMWAKMYKPNGEERKERSHKDGIKIGLESNEALEEYFFKAQLNDSYITNSGLVKHELSREVYDEYLTYQAVVRLNKPGLYLAKNNNFILRYESMRKYNPMFLFVVLYRHPLYHAASLLEKHLQYSSLQKDDPFVLEYMDWLGHHEFGINQKPFIFSPNDAPTGDKETLDYWLNIWINYYTYAQTLKHENTIFCAYETYCQNPEETINTVTKKLDLPTLTKSKKAFSNTRKVEFSYDPVLLEQALKIYHSFNV